MIKARVWQKGESVSDYFIDKMVLMSKYSASMSVSDRVDLIKEGIPHNWKVRLVGMSFKTLEEMHDFLILVEADLQEIRAGAALTSKSVAISEPGAINALGLDEMRKDFEALALSVTALRDELKESRKRPSTPGPQRRDWGGERGRSPDQYRSRGDEQYRSSRPYTPDRSRQRSGSRGRYDNGYRSDGRRARSRDRYDDRDRYRSDSRNRSQDRSRRDRYDQDRSRRDDDRRSSSDRYRDGSKGRHSSRDRQGNSSNDKDSKRSGSKNGQE
jgi:hypothetical protein